MRFCINCGRPAEFNENKEKCSCGFTKITDYKIISIEKIKKKEEKGKGTFIPEKFEEKGFPHICKKCRYEYADVVDLGSSWADESNIYLFKCKKCSYVTRDAYGSQ